MPVHPREIEESEQHTAPPAPAPQTQQETAPAPAYGAMAGSPSPAAVLAMQRSAGNQAVQRYLAGATLQRKEGDVAAPPEAAPATGAGGTPAQAAPPGTDTRTLTLTAIFNNVPGESKNKVRKATESDALWFDPLKTHSDAPQVADSTKAKGVATGGQQQVESFGAPVTGGPKPIGRGSITAQLKYTSRKNDSYAVEVTGLPAAQDAKATKAAKEYVKERIDVFGDVDQIAAQTEQHLAQTYPGAKVAINVVPARVEDTGRSSFYYKLRGNAGILMDVQVVPVAEKQVVSGGSKTSGSSSEDSSTSSQSKDSSKVDIDKKTKEAEKATSKSKELVESTYNESVAKTLDDYVSKTTNIHVDVAKDLAKKVVTDSKYNATETETSSYKKEKVTDYTKNVEKGEKSKDNWAEKIKKGVKVAKKVTSIPFIDKIPGVGWLSRKVKGWQLDLIEEAADIFAETGKAQYEDTKVHEKVTDKGDGKTEKESEIQRHDVQKTTERLTEEYTNETKEEWKRHLDEVTKTSKEYRSLVTKEGETTKDASKDESYNKTESKESDAASSTHKQAQNQSVTTTFQVSQNWTFSVPVVNARVVSGDAEVSASAFGPDPDEQAAPAPTKAP